MPTRLKMHRQESFAQRRRRPSCTGPVTIEGGFPLVPQGGNHHCRSFFRMKAEISSGLLNDSHFRAFPKGRGLDTTKAFTGLAFAFCPRASFGKF